MRLLFGRKWCVALALDYAIHRPCPCRVVRRVAYHVWCHSLVVRSTFPRAPASVSIGQARVSGRSMARVDAGALTAPPWWAYMGIARRDSMLTAVPVRQGTNLSDRAARRPPDSEVERSKHEHTRIHALRIHSAVRRSTPAHLAHFPCPGTSTICARADTAPSAVFPTMRATPRARVQITASQTRPRNNKSDGSARPPHAHKCHGAHPTMHQSVRPTHI